MQAAMSSRGRPETLSEGGSRSCCCRRRYSLLVGVSAEVSGPEPDPGSLATPAQTRVSGPWCPLKPHPRVTTAAAVGTWATSGRISGILYTPPIGSDPAARV